MLITPELIKPAKQNLNTICVYSANIWFSHYALHHMGNPKYIAFDVEPTAVKVKAVQSPTEGFQLHGNHPSGDRVIHSRPLSRYLRDQFLTTSNLKFQLGRPLNGLWPMKRVVK